MIVQPSMSCETDETLAWDQPHWPWCTLLWMVLGGLGTVRSSFLILKIACEEGIIIFMWQLRREHTASWFRVWAVEAEDLDLNWPLLLTYRARSAWHIRVLSGASLHLLFLQPPAWAPWEPAGYLEGEARCSGWAWRRLALRMTLGSGTSTACFSPFMLPLFSGALIAKVKANESERLKEARV